MSAEDRPGPQTTARVRTDADEASTPSSADRVSRSSIRSTTGSTTEPLSYRIERVRLQARIAALERELVASECYRQSIVGQYELLLEERSRQSDDADSGGFVDTVRRLLRPSR